jgi:hypothetical protein
MTVNEVDAERSSDGEGKDEDDQRHGLLLPDACVRG